MNEDALRALVRETLARLDARDGGQQPPQVRRAPEPVPVLMHNLPSHVSHYRYRLPPAGGPCQIEPGVMCEHCGYCESHGH